MAHNLVFDTSKLGWARSPAITDVPQVGVTPSQAEVNAIVDVLNEVLAILRHVQFISESS